MNLQTFHFLFATGMVCFPLFGILLDYWMFRRSEPGMGYAEADAIYRRGIRWLSAVTILLLFAFYAWFLIDGEAIQEKRRPFLIYLEIAAFHVLWWPGGGLIHTRAAQVQGGAYWPPFPGQDETTRVASLKPRRVSDDLPAAARPLPILIVITAVAAVGYRLLTWADDSRIPLQCWIWTFIGILVVAGYGFWIRREVSFPQPLMGDEDTARRYHRELEGNRRFRVRCIFVIQVFFSTLFFALGYLCLDVARGNLSGTTLGYVGGLGGSLIGLLGGIFGIAGSAKMRRVQSFRQQLTAQHKPTRREIQL